MTGPSIKCTGLMSHPNSHLRAARGRPPPEDLPQRERGQRRPRSPEAPPQPTTPPRNSSPEPITLITKSPHSRRTIKKGKLTGDNHPVPHPTPLNHILIESPQTSDPSSEPSTKNTPTTTLPADPGSAQTLLGHLTAQLETALRSADTLFQKYPDPAQLDTSCTKQVLRQLIERLNPGAKTQASAPPSQNSDRNHPPTQKKTYAEATSATKRPTGPPRTHRTMTGTKPGPPRRTDFAKLIVEFDDTVKQIPSDQIKDQLNDLFTSVKNAVRVTGAQFSRKGNLVLTVTPAISAQHILVSDWAAATISSLRDSLGFSEKVAQSAKIYPADPWHRVVIHNVPLRDVQKGPKGSWWEQNTASMMADWHEDNPLSHSMAVHCRNATKFLIPTNVSENVLKAKGSISMCIAFDNIKHARRLIQEGAFIHGSHCRVSPYRPMSRSRG